MKLQNLSVRAFLRKIVAGTLLTAALLLLIFFLLTKDVRVVICGIILTAAFFIWGIHVRVRDWEMYLRIDVTDTGRGIPEHSQGTIFKRFYRDEAVHDIDGVGIGLYLAREIITMQGGYITVESKVGEGSTFSVFLPIK